MKRTKLKVLSVILALSLVLGIIPACSSSGAAFPADLFLADSTSEVIDFEESGVPLSAGAPINSLLMPVASGTDFFSNNSVVIDVSNKNDGYVMIKYTGTSKAKLKVLVTGPSAVQYQYNLNTEGTYEVFPLSDGNGKYTVGVYQNTTGTKYAALLSKSITVEMKDLNAPFLLPNQYVNYTAESDAVKKAAELVKDCKTDLEKITAVYDFVIATLTYDKQKAQTVQSGYLPVIDTVLKDKKGICFDYAALMTAMLRSQGVPTKLVVGYSGTDYHAWLNTYTKEEGWVDGVVFFDGSTWKRMDPTFASGTSAKKMKDMVEYIGDGKNYTEKYLY